MISMKTADGRRGELSTVLDSVDAPPSIEASG